MIGLRLRRGLGQHHLRHPELCAPVIAFLRPRGHLVVEVGSGGGALTAELLKAGARVLALEIDLSWACHLREGIRDAGLCVMAVDVQGLNWRRLPPGALVAGNLPFAISTALIETLLSQARGTPRAAFLVQREVADRLVAKAGDRAYGSYSVLVAAWAEARILARVKAGSFQPPPRVDSAFVGLELRQPPLSVEEMPQFVATVRLAFSRRRKTLHNNLAAAWGRAEAERVLQHLGLDRKCRAEALGLETFVRIHQIHARL